MISRKTINSSHPIFRGILHVCFLPLAPVVIAIYCVGLAFALITIPFRFLLLNLMAFVAYVGFNDQEMARFWSSKRMLAWPCATSTKSLWEWD